MKKKLPQQKKIIPAKGFFQVLNFIFISLLITFLLVNCNRFELNKEQDPLIGKWKMFKKTKDGLNIPIDECLSSNFIEFKTNNKYIETISYKDSLDNCFTYNDYGEWYFYNGNYNIDNLTIINQNRKIKIENDILIYYYQAWNDPFGNFTTNDIERYYKK